MNVSDTDLSAVSDCSNSVQDQEVEDQEVEAVEEGPASLDLPDDAKSDQDFEPGAFSKAASAVGKAASVVGKGIGAAYRITAENRHYLNAVLCGFLGDRLAEAADPRAVSMSFRQSGRSLGVDELDLSSRLRGAGRTVVVTIHGLMCDEVMFEETRWQSTSPSRPGHGMRLERELGVTVLNVRYNTGLHISENGRILSALLEELVAASGSGMDRLILVAHSMGGLVARSAGYYGRLDGCQWVKKLSTVVLLGVPAKGSYVEQLANLSAFMLNRVGNLYTTLGGQIIEQRSNGIRDLRFGFMVDEDWRDHPKDDRLRATRMNIPPISGVNYHIVVGTLGSDENSPIAHYFGDGLVSTQSALGEMGFQPTDPVTKCSSCKVFASTGHFEILTSPEVGEHVVSLVRKVSLLCDHHPML